MGANQTGPMLMKLTTICDVSQVISYTRPSSPLFVFWGRAADNSRVIGQFPVKIAIYPCTWALVGKNVLSKIRVTLLFFVGAMSSLKELLESTSSAGSCPPPKKRGLRDQICKMSSHY